MKYVEKDKNCFPMTLNGDVIRVLGLIKACILWYIESDDEKGTYINVEYISDCLGGYTKSIITKAINELDKEKIIYRSLVEESFMKEGKFFEYYKINYDVLNTVMGWK